ncbi:SHOCT domain-containing protein [Pseudanabaena sp. FACHB-2040]|uniref:SHOCT domain-containing protein n=1 Tax=Pseudanabaena sp. FACHB-2040 TaxID=2692859 RepID=UPI0018EFFABC
MGKTTVISGTATATSRAVNNATDQKALRSQQEQTAAIQAQADLEQVKAQMAALQQPAPAPALAPTPIPTPQSNLLAQLTQLAQLKEAGALTDDEFQLAKAKLLT